MKKYLKIMVLVLTLILLSACTKIEISEKLDFEVNSEVKYEDLVKKNEKITLVNGNDLINTSTLGKKEVTVKYSIGKKVKEEKVIINIIDTTPPVIEASETLFTTQGKEVDLLTDVKVTDNSGEELTAEVVGTYDINTMGEYKLQYSATDSSGNNATKDFTLSVKNISVKTNGYYVYKGKNSWVGVQFKSGNKVNILYNYCPGDACGAVSESGTYSYAEKKVIMHLTSSSSEDGTVKMDQKYEFDIVDENNIKYKNNIYTWKEKFN